MPQNSTIATLRWPIPAEFLGYCGLEKLWDFTQRFQSCLDHLDRDDFLAVVSQMALYVNCLGGWNLHLFPWDTGDHLRQQCPAEVSQPS